MIWEIYKFLDTYCQSDIADILNSAIWCAALSSIAHWSCIQQNQFFFWISTNNGTEIAPIPHRIGLFAKVLDNEKSSSGNK